MNNQKLEQIKFMLGIESNCDVMTLQDMQLLKDYIQNYDLEENYNYAFCSDGITEEELYRFSCSLHELMVAFMKSKKAERFLHKQISSAEFQLIKDDYEVITVKTI